MFKYLVIALVGIGLSAPAIARAEDKEEGAEEKVAFSTLPQAVQKTLAKEADGQRIESVEKETEDGQTVYEADVKINGKPYEIKVAADGTLIEKKLDRDDDRPDAKDQKNDKDDGKAKKG